MFKLCRASVSARIVTAASLAVFMSGVSVPAAAEVWGDTYIGWRYGTHFGEPYETNDIHKNIFNLNHVGGYKYGTNFFNADFLLSDSKDPENANTTAGAQEVYLVYRNTVDFSKVTGTDYKMGIMRSWGVTGGFDYNNKSDAGYNSKKRMLVFGPSVMLDVPGFLQLDLLEFWESNAPCNTFTNTCVSRYRYKTHPALGAEWGIPIGDLPLSFEGFALYIASKGKDEFGAQTKPETNFDGQIMLDVGRVVGGPKNTFKVGFEYQYWRNKFGNDHDGPAGQGAFAKTPMIRAEYHF